MEVKGIKEGFASVGTAIKNGAVWLGRQIKLGFDKLVPLIKRATESTLQFLRTPGGLSTLGFGIGATLLGIANTKWLEGDTKKFARIALKITAVLMFIATGVGIGFAVSTGNAILL